MNGPLLDVDGLTVLVGADQERRPSRDMRWHICLSEDVYHNVVINCLFEPPVAKGIGDKGKRIASP